MDHSGRTPPTRRQPDILSCVLPPVRRPVDRSQDILPMRVAKPTVGLEDLKLVRVRPPTRSFEAGRAIKPMDTFGNIKAKRTRGTADSLEDLKPQRTVKPTDSIEDLKMNRDKGESPEEEEVASEEAAQTSESSSKDEDEESVSGIEESNALQAVAIGLVCLVALFSLIFLFQPGAPGHRSYAVHRNGAALRAHRRREVLPGPYPGAAKARRRVEPDRRRDGRSGFGQEPYTRRLRTTSNSQPEVSSTPREQTLSTYSTSSGTQSTAPVNAEGESIASAGEGNLSRIGMPPLPRKLRPLICATAQLGKRSVFPEDGICDFVIFRDVTLGDREWVSATSGGRLRPFLDKASRSRKSIYMLSFPARISNEVKSFLLSNLTSVQLIRKYLSRNIRGYGFALVDHEAKKFAEDAQHYTEIIKLFDERMKSATSTGGITFVGLLLRNNGNGDVANSIKELMTHVDLFIAISHTPMPAPSPDCLVLPISSWSSEHLNDVTLQTTAFAVALVQHGKTRNTTVFALSSSLGRLKFKIDSVSDKGIEGIWNVKCTEVSLDAFQNECTGHETLGSIGTRDFIVYDYDKSNHTWRSYETIGSLRSKIEKVFEVLHPSRKSPLGWALYDVDLEDYKGECNAAFPHKYQEHESNRLTSVKELLLDKKNVF